jgi:hypothetical protein
MRTAPPPTAPSAPAPARLDDQIRKCDEQLMRFREQLKKTRPGPAQEALKRRAMTVRRGGRGGAGGGLAARGRGARGPGGDRRRPPRAAGRRAGAALLRAFPLPNLSCGPQVLRQKKMFEGQRETLYNQQFNMEQTRFTVESIQVRRRAGARRWRAARRANSSRSRMGRARRAPAPSARSAPRPARRPRPAEPTAPPRLAPPRPAPPRPAPPRPGPAPAAQDTVQTVKALKGAAKEMRGTMKANKELDLNFIDKLQDELADMAVRGGGVMVEGGVRKGRCSGAAGRGRWRRGRAAAAAGRALARAPRRPRLSQHPTPPPPPPAQDLTTEINEVMGQSFAVPEDVDEVRAGASAGPSGAIRADGAPRAQLRRVARPLPPLNPPTPPLRPAPAFALPPARPQADLMAELDALELDMAAEPVADGSVPSYLQARAGGGRGGGGAGGGNAWRAPWRRGDRPICSVQGLLPPPHLLSPSLSLTPPPPPPVFPRYPPGARPPGAARGAAGRRRVGAGHADGAAVVRPRRARAAGRRRRPSHRVSVSRPVRAPPLPCSGPLAHPSFLQCPPVRPLLPVPPLT